MGQSLQATGGQNEEVTKVRGDKETKGCRISKELKCKDREGYEWTGTGVGKDRDKMEMPDSWMEDERTEKEK